MMSHSIAYGRLRVVTPTGEVYEFPSPERRKELGLGEGREEETAEIRVIRDTFWLRLVVLADLGFAEAYMAGDCEVSDLVKVFKVCHGRTSTTQVKPADSTRASSVLDLLSKPPHPISPG